MSYTELMLCGINAFILYVNVSCKMHQDARGCSLLTTNLSSIERIFETPFWVICPMLDIGDVMMNETSIIAHNSCFLYSALNKA